MVSMGAEDGGRIRLDDKRRTTFPASVLAAAGVPAGVDLVVRADGPGRLVLESPAAILKRAQDAVRAGKAARAAATGDPALATASLADQLLAERRADTSLHTPHRPDDQQNGEDAPGARTAGQPTGSTEHHTAEHDPAGQDAAERPEPGVEEDAAASAQPR